MVPRNTRTLIIKSAFPAGVSHAGVADIIGKSLSGQIDSIQVCPGGIIRVSFLDPQSKRSYEEAGSISFDDVCCQVLCSTPVTHVLVYLFPFEGSNDHIKEALKYFGEIKEVKCQQWTNVPGVATGTRIVRMVRRHEIPRNIVIDGVKCRVWYKGQPLVCDICSNNHKAADCPLRGKCRRCHQAGHFVRECPKPVWYVPGREDNPSSASSVAPPSGEGSNPVGENTTVLPDEDGEVPVSQASQSVLSVGVDPAPVVEDALASSQAPSETSGGEMDLDSLDLRDNELDEVVSQPLPLSGVSLLGSASESASGGAPASVGLVSPEETARLVKNLKAVLPVSIDPAVGEDTQSSSGDTPHEFVVPLPPRVRQRPPSVRTASRSRSRSGDERSPPVSPAGPHRTSRSRQSPSPARPRSSSVPQSDHHR